MAVKVLTVVLKYSCTEYTSSLKWVVKGFIFWPWKTCMLSYSYFSSICLESEGMYIALTSSSTLEDKNFSDCKIEHPSVIFASFLLGNHALQSKNSDACQQL